MARVSRQRVSGFKITGYAVCLVYAAVILVPLVYLLMSGFKENQAIFEAPLGFPNAPTLEKFRLAFQFGKFGRAFFYSAIVVVASEAVTLAIAYPASYAIARFRTKAANWAGRLYAAGFLIPTLPLLLSTYLMASKFGLLYNPLMLILFYPAARIPFTTLFLTPFVRSIPRSLEEAAKIDGATRFQTMRSIFIPLSMPGIANVIVLNFLFFWNEFIFALVILDSRHRTIQVALSSLTLDVNTFDFGMIAAGVITVTVPVYVLFLIFQERVVTGMLVGSVKG